MTLLNSIVYITRFKNDRIKISLLSKHKIAIKRLSGSMEIYSCVKSISAPSYHLYKNCTRLQAPYLIKGKDGEIEEIIPNSGIVSFNNFRIQMIKDNFYQEIGYDSNLDAVRSTILEILGFNKCTHCHTSEIYENFLDDYGGMTPDEWHEQTRIDTENYLESIKGDSEAWNKWHGIE